MNGRADFHAAVSAAVLGSASTQRALLQSIVDVARAILGARASSIMLYDEDSDELVFEAVSGEGAETLVGRRHPSGEGIAGWVLSARQPLVVEDVAADPRFSRGLAENTGYVPKGLVAVPLLDEDRPLGVLSVLDRPERATFSLHEMDLLSLFGNQAAIALELVQRERRAQALLEDRDDELAAVARVARALDELEDERREGASRLLAALEEVLRAP